MTTLELENTVATTDRWTSGFGLSVADQQNPATRRMTLDVYLSDLETLAIESNAEFHATILERLADAAPQTISSDDLLT